MKTPYALYTLFKTTNLVSFMTLWQTFPLCEPWSRCCHMLDNKNDAAKLIIKDNKRRLYHPESLKFQLFHGVWAQTNDRDDRGSRHGSAAKQTNMEQADRIYSGWYRLCCGSGQCLEVPLSLLQERRRWETKLTFHPQTELWNQTTSVLYWLYDTVHTLHSGLKTLIKGWQNVLLVSFAL